MKKNIISYIFIITNLICYGQSTESIDFKQIRTLNGNKFKLFVNGNSVNENLYDEIKNFKEGFAAVKREGKWCYINLKGIEIIPPTFFEVSDFSNGFAIVMNNKLDKAFLNKSGKMITTFKYYAANNFQEGYAAVATGTYPNLNWGFINNEGKEVFIPKYSRVDDFKDGIAKVFLKNKVGFINETGKEITQIIYYDSGSRNLGNGLAALQQELNNRTSFVGVINKKGEWMFKRGQIYFQVVGSFSNKYLIVDNGSKFGIVDHSGNIKIEINMKKIDPLGSWTRNTDSLKLGRLYVENYGDYFYIDENLNCVNMDDAIPCSQ